IEFGAHTIHHEILSRLDRDEKRREIAESTAVLRRHVRAPVTTFAYPFGRPWDFDEECFELLREEGYDCACAAIDGTNDPGTDRWQLRRLPLNDDIPLADVLAEIDGTLPLFRRLFRVRI
ncbi:MAG: polysaccharide deacetylase family protein, partial [Planctomycetota bacterium JB042]